jgi:hypothetical protein
MVPNIGSVIVINFLGWSLIGWVVALANEALQGQAPGCR